MIPSNTSGKFSHLHIQRVNVGEGGKFSDVETAKQNKLKDHTSTEKAKILMMNNILKKSTSLTALAPMGLSFSPKKKIMEKQPSPEDSADYSPTARFVKTSSSKKLQHGMGKQRQRGQARKVINITECDMEFEQTRKRVYNIPYIIDCEEESKEDHSILLASSQKYSQTLSTSSSQRVDHRLKLSDFKLSRVLGAGKFGKVHQARYKFPQNRHIESGFVCALKQIKKNNLDEVLKCQLIRQIKIQMFLNHPNIVKLYTFFSDEDCIYLVLELCTSGQLYNFLRKKQPVQENLAKVIIRQICQGLDYIHENKIIHRDLKPENVLYHNGMMKICDFGWSIDTHLMRETFCGTPLYVSPELLRRKGYDNKVDTWSLGVLSYEILTGRVPFEIFSQSDYIKIIQNQIKFSKNVQLSEEAKNFISSCLQKDPQQRLNSSQLLMHPFIQKVQVINFPEIF